LSESLRKFYKKHGVLPVRSGIPDLTSDTNNYLQLKKIYERKAEEDRKEILSFIKETTNKVIEEENIKTFCDNIFNIDYITYRSIDEEFDTPKELEVFETDCYKWHFVLRANS